MNTIKDEVYWVIENKILGVRKPINKHELSELKDINVAGIITLLDDQENHQLYTENNFNFLWLPIKGGTTPSDEQINLATDYIEKVWDQESAIAVHCSGGKKRTVTLIASVLIHQGHRFEEVMEKILKANPEIKLNENQLNFLKSL